MLHNKNEKKLTINQMVNILNSESRQNELVADLKTYSIKNLIDLNRLYHDACSFSSPELTSKNLHFKKKLNANLIDAIQEANISDLTNEDIHYLYYIARHYFQSNLRKLDRSCLKELAKKITTADEKDSYDHRNVLNNTTSDLDRFLKDLIENKASEIINTDKAQIKLFNFIYHTEEVELKDYITDSELVLDDKLIATLFKTHHNRPDLLKNKLQILLESDLVNFDQKSKFSVLKNDYQNAEKELNLGTVIKYAQASTLCCCPELKDSNIKINNNALSNKNELLSRIIDNSAEFHVISDLFTIGAKSIFKDLFCIHAFSSYNNEPTNDARLTKIEELITTTESFDTLINSNQLSHLYNKVIVVLENEYKRLLHDTGDCFINNGCNKAAALLNTLNLIAIDVNEFLIKDLDSKQLLSKIHTCIETCLNQPVIKEHRNQTADILRAILGIVLFVPLLGATYWSAKLHNMFFGAPTVVNNLTRINQDLIDSPNLIASKPIINNAM